MLMEYAIMSNEVGKTMKTSKILRSLEESTFFITCTLFWVCSLHPLMTLFEHVKYFTYDNDNDNNNDSWKFWSFNMSTIIMRVGSL
jgi:hypothetical protein